jgi:hypothetical protein
MSYLFPLRWTPAGPPPITRRTIRPLGLAAILELLAAGELRRGDRLIWQQPRAGQNHVAVVRADGWLVVRGRAFSSPSGAARYACGRSANGWEVWRCARDGRLLASKRDRIRGRRR